MLRDANTARINDKYAEDAAYVYGYRYQSDESPTWFTSPTAAFCQTLESGKIRSLPGCDSGPGTIEPSSIQGGLAR